MSGLEGRDLGKIVALGSQLSEKQLNALRGNSPTAEQILSGLGIGQSNIITDYNATTKIATLNSSWTDPYVNISISNTHSNNVATDKLNLTTVVDNNEFLINIPNIGQNTPNGPGYNFMPNYSNW